jgi:hypothetical protein
MNNKLMYPLLYIIAGAIIGAAIMWKTAGCWSRQSCDPIDETDSINLGIRQIDSVQANNFFKAYMLNPHVDTLYGFTINAQQFEAMKLISENDPAVGGFRIYMGVDSLTPVRMVVGTGSPDHVATIYSTTDEASGPCPHICDDASPIIDR